jgi:hypothetical protein
MGEARGGVDCSSGDEFPKDLWTWYFPLADGIDGPGTQPGRKQTFPTSAKGTECRLGCALFRHRGDI